MRPEFSTASRACTSFPTTPLLGEFRPEFAGLMGFLEERVGGSQERPGPLGRRDGDHRLRLAAGPDGAQDLTIGRRPVLFLTARLFDVLIGDWDRHAGQWSWARFGNAVPRRWVPIPQDRDQAFAKYDGVLLTVARQTAPQLTNFGSGYPYLAGATWNGRDLDRRLLVELEWPVWESAAIRLQSALSDAVIDEAVRALPPEHYALAGAKLAAALRSRRDHLLKAARGYYDLLAKQVDVHATDAGDEASLTRRARRHRGADALRSGQGGRSLLPAPVRSRHQGGASLSRWRRRPGGRTRRKRWSYAPGAGRRGAGPAGGFDSKGLGAVL